jgi:hypothetical protein
MIPNQDAATVESQTQREDTLPSAAVRTIAAISVSKPHRSGDNEAAQTGLVLH